MSLLAPAHQMSLVPPVVVTNKNIQCFFKAPHSWKTTGSLFLIRDRPGRYQRCPLRGSSGKETQTGTGCEHLQDSAQQSRGRSRCGQRGSPGEHSPLAGIWQWGSTGRWWGSKPSRGMRDESTVGVQGLGPVCVEEAAEAPEGQVSLQIRTSAPTSRVSSRLQLLFILKWQSDNRIGPWQGLEVTVYIKASS